MFAPLARRAVAAVALVLVAGALAYAWNARRLRALAAPPPAEVRRQRRWLRRWVDALVVRQPAARAGFYFAIAAMWRSRPHRLTLACAAAIGMAMAILAASRVDFDADGVPARFLSVQPLLCGALLVGFRHAIRVPAELRANWGVQLAWRNQQRAFVAGVKRAAIVVLVVPALVALLPIFAVVLGPHPAIVHALLGLAGALVLLEALMAGYDKVPFTCTYVPSDRIHALAPIGVIAFVAGSAIFARLEQEVLQGTNAVPAVAAIAVAWAVARLIALARARPPVVRFDEAPATFQRLGLDA
jgi:hypothetical protein